MTNTKPLGHSAGADAPSSIGDAARHSTVVAGFTLVSRATGLIRVVVIGAVLGPTYFANGFVVTNTLPNLIYTTVAGHGLALVVVPAVVRALPQGGTRRASRLLSHVGGFLLFASAAIAAVTVLASPLLAWMFTFGIADPVLQGHAQHLTIALILLVAPQVVLYTLAAIGQVAQQAREHFALPAAAPAVENIVLIAAVSLGGAIWGTGLEVGAVPVGLLVMLGAGSTFAVAVHACIQMFGAARVGLRIRPAFRWWSDPAATEVARRIGASVSVPGGPALGLFALMVAASSVPGGGVVLQAAYSVYFVPIALGAHAVSTAVLPGMSAAAHRDDRQGFASWWRQALTYSAVASLPPLVLLGILARPVADILAYGKLDSGLVVEQLAACIAVVAVAQVIKSVHTVGEQALFARIDVRGPRQASLALLAVMLVVAAGSLLVPAGTVRLIVLCMAFVAADLAAAITVIVKLRTALRPERIVNTAQILKSVAAAAAMSPVVAVGWWVLKGNDDGRLATLAVLVSCGISALAVYAAVLRTGTRRMGRMT